MKHTELRIGNIVSHEDYTSELFKVIEIITVNNSYVVNTSGGKNGTWTNSIELVNPIPLTEEWLLKLGFGSKYKSVHTRWNYGLFGVDQKSDEDDEGESIPVEQVFYYEGKVDLLYVHQLQNLYFALTGEELNTL